MNPILMLDNQSADSSMIYDDLIKKGFAVSRVHKGHDALALVRDNAFSSIVIWGDHEGEDESVIPGFARLSQPVPVIYVTGSPSINEAVRLTRQGVSEYFDSSQDRDRIVAFLEKTLPEQTEERNQDGAGRSKAVTNIIGNSEQMQHVFSLIRKVCDTDTTVLVQGESGTGKELVAQALHYESSRCNEPFIPVNCGAIPGELLESELFGHEKGAFTHAIRTRIGRFELVDGGTIFLDEISEMPPMLQVKILRVLQEREFERIGGTKTISSDFRVIAATNRNLEEEVKKGRFRQDLFYRLNVIPIEVPPLRLRTEDIPPLIDYFIDKFNRTKKKAITGIDGQAMQLLMRYSWPGNVRDLENVVERMVILAMDDLIIIDDLPVRIREHESEAGRSGIFSGKIPAEGFCLSDEVASYEKKLIARALEQTGGIKNRAAKLLSVNRTTLLEKMKRYQMEKD